MLLKAHQVSLNRFIYRAVTDLFSDFKIPLGQALTAYLSTSATISLNLRNRLDSLQKGYQLYGEPPSKDLDVQMMDGMNMNALQFEASVLDGPVINSRAGLYVYINALVSMINFVA